MRANGHVLSLSEMKRRFHGQWLAIRVTRRDEAGQPTAGKVLARSPSRLEVSEAVKGVAHVCLVYAGEPIPKGYGVVFRGMNHVRWPQHSGCCSAKEIVS